MVKDKTLLEKLAAVEHDQWVAWAKTMILAEDVTISAERKTRWASYIVPYDQLTEDVKDHDRVWARKVLEVLNS